MTTTSPNEIGTLIVVILKARNLPNKRHLGKQTPYCSVKLNGETRRTKAIKRGGQHPEWDDEIRFTLYEDDEPNNGVDGTPPLPPPKNGKPRKIKGGHNMFIACFADDPREPDLIGDTMVDLTEVLTKGETDEWFTLTNKDKYCGEVYLELTFWSNAPPPQKKSTPVSTRAKGEWGGAGEFTPLGDDDGSDPNAFPDQRRVSNMSSQIDLYMPPYEQSARGGPPRAYSVDQVANDFGELGVGDSARRRDTYPPIHGEYSATASGSFVPSSISSHNSAPAERRTCRPFTPYQPPYEQGPPPSSSFSYQPTARQRPRYSMPVKSSGFMPVPSASEPSGFAQHTLSSHVSEPGGFAPPPSGMSMASYPPPVSHTPMPGHATPAPSTFSQMPSRTPAPSSLVTSGMPPNQPYQLQPSPSYTPGQQIPFPQQSGYGHHPPPPPPSSSSLAMNGTPTSTQSVMPPLGGAYGPGAPPPIPPLSQGYPRSFPTSSFGPPPTNEQSQHPLPTPPGPPGPLGPSPPRSQPVTPSGSYDRTSAANGSLVLPSSIPPPPLQRSVSGRPSLPQPPPGPPPAQQPIYQPLPPPPAPPQLRRSSSQVHMSASQHQFPPSSSFQPAYPGPPPRPPVQMLAPPHNQWAPNQYSQGY
ncbi:hypothetical protein OF83DRAFT_1162511 [Amylostereum chailletii]|nr:hypothetical protein OF83DRAFT_1162511 [Amylostereum chailletii]